MLQTPPTPRIVLGGGGVAHPQPSPDKAQTRVHSFSGVTSSRNKSYKYVSSVVSYISCMSCGRHASAASAAGSADLCATLLDDLFHPFNLRQFTLRFAFRGQFPPPRRCFGFLHPCYVFRGVSSCGYIRPRPRRCRW